jgi:hypothetical protein
MRLRSLALAIPLAFSALASSPVAEAFCGFYVAGADQKLFNNATTVVLMREGTRTVLSMQNNYQGPPENFAMVVPVPVVLQQENVKTLPTEIFDKIDKLASPRLVEYWEQDPCAPPEPPEPPRRSMRYRSLPMDAKKDKSADDLGVTIEAQFSVGEYEVVILSARDSAGLDKWLKLEKYKIPEGSEPLLRPYVQGGAKFFVAKVDPKKITFENGQALLSPLRFHYDSDTFALPVRLGLVNSAGAQDLIVHILAKGQRYETANYPNVAIPTNLDVKDAVRTDFGGFYAALFDRTLSRQPKAVITEYAWDAGTCDPCPGPTLNGNDLATLGWDVLTPTEVASGPDSSKPNALRMKRRMPGWRGGTGFVLTRLHLRYGKEGLGEDLVFRQAQPIVGGREFLTDGKQLETGAVESQVNNFQARYSIRHPWTGPVSCANPRRGIWGGPPAGKSSKGIEAAQKLAFAKRGMDLMAFVARDDNETKIDSAPLIAAPAMYSAAPETSETPAPVNSAATPPGNVVSGPPPTPPKSGCAGCRVGETSNEMVPFGATIAAAVGLLLARMRRRK